MRPGSSNLKREDHKATNIVLKRGNVDKMIQPVVKWLNSFPGTFTRWSCESDDKDDSGFKPQRPFVIFFCDSRWELLQILRKVRSESIEVEVQFFEDMYTRYIMKFHNKSVLRGFASSLIERGDI